MKNKYYVYRFKNIENEILYVGKTTNLKSRLSSHDHLPKECYDDTVIKEYIAYKDETTCDYAEKYFISKLQPIYNTHYKELSINHNFNAFDCAVWRNYNSDEVFKAYSQTKTMKLRNLKAITYDISKSEFELNHTIRIIDSIEATRMHYIFNNRPGIDIDNLTNEIEKMKSEELSERIKLGRLYNELGRLYTYKSASVVSNYLKKQL